MQSVYNYISLENDHLGHKDQVQHRNKLFINQITHKVWIIF